jgi:hypothetical protein
MKTWGFLNESGNCGIENPTNFRTFEQRDNNKKDEIHVVPIARYQEVA